MGDGYKTDWIGTIIMWFVFLFLWIGYVGAIQSLGGFLIVLFMYFMTNHIHAFIMDFIEGGGGSSSSHGGHTPTGHA